MRVNEPKIEELDADDAKIAQMLAGLKRVDAPANFEFKLKARIANAARPTRGLGFIPSFVRYAAPLALIAAVSSLFYLNSSSDPAPVQTAGVAPQISTVSEIANMAAAPGETSTAAAVETPRPLLAANRSKLPVSTRPVDVKLVQRNTGEQDRSKVSAVTPPRIILPRGITPNGLPDGAQSPPMNNKVDLTASGVFPILGIDALYDDGWKVRAVKVNGMGDRAGVKAGDVLEAIDENQLGKDAVFKSGFNGKVMKVRRDGKLLELRLQNK
ncbi:MAG: hypothetical protein ABI791_08550 [Acidobacteriota bacterium]